MDRPVITNQVNEKKDWRRSWMDGGEVQFLQGDILI